MTTAMPFLRALVLLLLPLLSASKTSEEGLAWMDENAKQPGVESSFGGYQYKILQQGHGVLSPDSGQAYVRCHYEGRLTDGTVFESTYSIGKPKEFRPIDVHDGWFATLLDMVEGDIYELVLPSELTTFGDEGGADGKVKGGDVVIYKLELVKITGKTRSALKCNVTTPAEYCNSKEQSYIRKAKAKTNEEISKDLNRHSTILKDEELEPKVENWTHRRIHMLKQIVQENKQKKFEEKEELKCIVEKPTEHCNAKELDYIEKVLQRMDTVLIAHLEQATNMLKKGGLEPEIEDWTHRRIHILSQVIGSDNDESRVFSWGSVKAEL